MGRTFEAVAKTARFAIIICARVVAAPMLRSMPAVRMTSVWAIARVPTTTVCCVTNEMFCGSRKRSFSA